MSAPISERAVAVVHQDSTYAVAAVAEAAARELELRFALALKHPRDEKKASEALLAMCSDPEFAAEALYDVERGADGIQGLSVRFTEAALQVWGHVHTAIEVLQESDTLRIGRVSVYDCQTGTSYSAAVTIRKVVERYDSGGRRVLETRSKLKWDQNKRENVSVPFYLCAATDDDVRERWENSVSKTYRSIGGRLLPATLRAACFRAAMAVAPSRDERKRRRRGDRQQGQSQTHAPQQQAPVAVDIVAECKAAGLDDAQIGELCGVAPAQLTAPQAKWVAGAARDIKAGRATFDEIMERKNAGALVIRARDLAHIVNGGDEEAAEQTLAQAARDIGIDLARPRAELARRLVDSLEGMAREQAR